MLAVMEGLREIFGARIVPSPNSARPMLRRWPFLAGATALLIFHILHFTVSAGFGWLAAPAAAALAGPLLWSWYRPAAAWLAMLAATAVLTWLGLLLDSGPFTPRPWSLGQLAASLPIMYVLSLVSARRVAAAAYALTLALTIALAGLLDEPPERAVQGVLVWASAALAAVVVGQARRARRLDTQRIAEEHGRRLLLEERARIARELHDVVAHHMSVIAVQAASASHRVQGGVSEEAEREFAAIGTAARESLQEMRHLLGALRGSDDAVHTAPQPGVPDIGALVETVRRAGVSVRLTLTDPGVPLSAVVSLTAYRIVQEAVSNVVRHAPDALTSVVVHTEDDHLRVSVENGPSERVARPGSGQGLVGMRERVSALGGALTVGETAEGGFAVHARLPRSVAG